MEPVPQGTKIPSWNDYQKANRGRQVTISEWRAHCREIIASRPLPARSPSCLLLASGKAAVSRRTTPSPVPAIDNGSAAEGCVDSSSSGIAGASAKHAEVVDIESSGEDGSPGSTLDSEQSSNEGGACGDDLEASCSKA